MEEHWYHNNNESYREYMIRLWSDAELWLKLNFLSKDQMEDGVAVLWKMKQHWYSVSMEELKKDCISRTSFSRIEMIEKGETPFLLLHQAIARRAWDVYHEREI